MCQKFPTDLISPRYERVNLRRGPRKGELVVLHTSRNLANGGTVGCDGRLLFCFQGAKVSSSKVAEHEDAEVDSLAYLPAGVFSVSPHDWSDWRREFDAWGSSYRFNSPNDVIVSRRTGSLWFTDPSYASAQGYAPPALLGDWVWRYDPGTRNLAVVADGFSKPNGLAFSPDETVLYVTDTGFATGLTDAPFDRKLPRTVYAFDVIQNGKFLANRRLLYVADRGVPDGIKVDNYGNLYTGCLDGVHVLASDGCLLGKILIDGGVANLCFGRGLSASTLFILAEDAVFSVDLNVTGAPVGIEATTAREEEEESNAATGGH